MADCFKKKDIAVIGVLIAIEQFVKIIVNTFFFEKRIMIFGGMFGFKPYLNTTQLSLFNNELGLNIGINVLIFLNIILLPIIPLSVYLFFRKASAVICRQLRSSAFRRRKRDSMDASSVFS